MYEAFFHLHDRPFLPAPQTRRYFPASVIETSRKTLARCIERSEGPALVIGPSGTGKSLLCRLLAEQFAGRFDVAILASGRLSTRQALLQVILHDLGQPYRGLDEGELRLALLDYLEPNPQGSAGLLLLIDEAHAMPLRLLEEVRMLTNLVRDGQSRVRLVIAGNPKLEERFASPKLQAFSQRLAARCYLDALDVNETAAYVRAQITAVGGDPAKVFHDEALRTIYRASDGIPRLINQICDHALILASLGGMRCLTSEAIEEAWADLQQLPVPFAARNAEEAADGIVEFGSLEDPSAELPEAIPFRAAPAKPLQLRGAQPQLQATDEDIPTVNDRSLAVPGGTEVELDFPEFGDPLAEEFEEEELVLDRYGSDVPIFADVPRVTSWEGRQIGALLAPLDFGPPQDQEVARRPTLAAVAEPIVRQPASARQPVAEPQPARKITAAQPAAIAAEPLFSPASDPVLPEEPIAEPARPVAASPPRPIERPAPASQKRSESGPRTIDTTEADDIEVEDAEMIVVADEPASPNVTPHAPALVRKVEYRQLFARLRRG